MESELDRKITIAAVSVNLLLILFVFLIRKALPPVIPIFYGLPKGEEQLAPTTFLGLPAIISIIIAGINFALIRFLVKKPFLQNIILGLTLATTSLSTITIIKIIVLVGSF